MKPSKRQLLDQRRDERDLLNEYEAAVKHQQLDASGLALENIDFGEGPSTEETVEERNQAAYLCVSCDHDDSMSCSVSETDTC